MPLPGGLLFLVVACLLALLPFFCVVLVYGCNWFALCCDLPALPGGMGCIYFTLLVGVNVPFGLLLVVCRLSVVIGC